MEYARFSEKQRTALTWWMPGGEFEGYDAILCDGAVRSGKTLCMGLGFFLWAMGCFDGRRFGLCGKTVVSLQRNLISELLPRLRGLGMAVIEKRSEHRLEVSFGGRRNDFFCFGGKDEGSAALIQGVTLAGVLLDEVALMPRSFVEQAVARCSVAGAKLWFNCNPEGPGHWFYTQWVQQAQQRRCLRLQFTMDDNPSLSQRVRERYERLYAGTFYRRFVLGEWVAAEGRVYDFFSGEMVRAAPEGPFLQWYISCDYGTVNPASFGLWGLCGGVWYRVAEFYHDSRAARRQMTDQEYAQALRGLAGGRSIRAVIVDPSAASFMEVLRRDGWAVRRADNDVLAGIRRTADLLRAGKLVICEGCRDCLREMEQYVWDLRGGGRDTVRKEHDHAMDDMRYFAQTVLGEHGGFAVCAVAR